jgi:hypothetical protein
MNGGLPCMPYLKVRKRGNRNYAYYVTIGSDGSRKEKYVGPIANATSLTGTVCPRCLKTLDEETIRTALIQELTRAKDRMKADKGHITNYSRYVLLEEMINAISGGLPD